MKRQLFTLLILTLSMLLPALSWAQVQVSGKVTDAATDEPLPGVAVTVQGTTIGTQTDLEGNYQINVPSSGSMLEFRFLGYTNQTIAADRELINVELATSAQALNEVVVTAMGTQRSRNELPFAAEEVSAEELTRTRGANFMNSLSGKVSGLAIRQNNSLGGSTNVVIRGYKSITGNNQALFVIDGVPVSNANTNTEDQMEGFAGYDYGNAAADINPDNIASVNVLKGAAATALYGSRGANGVIMITTKKGRKNSLEVLVNSGFTVGSIDKTTFAEYQNEYGAGYESGFYDVSFPDGDGEGQAVLFDHDASFGSAFDPNLMVYQWDALDPASPNYHRKTPWVAAPNDPSDFYENSTNSNQSIVIRGGGDRSTFKAGYTRIDQTGVLPNSSLDKNLFNFSAAYDATPKLKISANANYSKIDGLGRYGTGYSGINVNQQFRQWWQVNVDIEKQKEAYFRNRRNVTWNWADLEGTGPIYSDNPYWTRYENYQNDTRNHYFGYAAADWIVTDWLSIMGRAAIDATDDFQEERVAVGSAGGTAAAEYGRYNRTYSEANYDLILNFNKSLSADLSLTGLLGGNMRRIKINSVRATTNGGLVVPGLYSLSNSVSPIEPPDENYERVGVDGIFASATLGYKETVFLDLTARRDQSTTLPEGNNVYYYPSAAASFLFSNVMEDSPWLSYGKLRVNYAEVGNDAPALSLFDVYDKPAGFGSIPIFSLPDVKNNEELKPERTKSIEAGLDMAFLDNRFGFEFSWYKTRSVDMIIPVRVSAATGYTERFINSGEMQNKGIELSAFITPVLSDNFSWRMDLNFTRNRNKVVSLYGEGDNKVENIIIGDFQAGSANAAVGYGYGVIKGSTYVYHENGQPIVRPNGYYEISSTSDNVIGDPNPDWIGGISNTLRYKGVSLNFLVDIRHGGDIFSLDQWYGMGTGLYPETAGLNELGVPKRAPVSENGGILLPGVQEDGSPNDVRAALSNGSANPYGYVESPEIFGIFDASYVKLREVALTWSLPDNWIENLRAFKGIDVSLIGRNLWIIHKNLPYSDPEEEDSAGNINGYQGGAYPTVRTLGMNVRFRF
ncbi:TonB-linked SusC/RagA family outer membrane protein [Anseongella ginsenosidimutans]|uniref:TonB-linked SusC/RagA family outer membrane protein n=1 Tax=Anseongella ginsenosidimutans TaxID=496056 RepID=A0A4R3KNL5_9SPHI|nr:SusC/RagA family TonB-linked outer membrane protein [Anseongella ginsenosidimutans]QEC52052.1 SusC/RagA family TonB-linked outer membrane protein [Anseongella ginsenosidimutans]TCS85639.1 TonB-linked SusC/RagA family outer membrane protein [Anseongella ginsenosidimutans]